MRRILVADDEPDMLVTIRNLLEMSFEDCEIKTAPDGQRALEMALRDPPGVLISDLKMPHLDGFELARKLEDAGQSTPMVLMTAFSDSSLETRAAQFPLIRLFVKKPVDPPMFIDAIRRCLPDD